MLLMLFQTIQFRIGEHLGVWCLHRQNREDHNRRDHQCEDLTGEKKSSTKAPPPCETRVGLLLLRTRSFCVRFRSEHQRRVVSRFAHAACSLQDKRPACHLLGTGF